MGAGAQSANPAKSTPGTRPLHEPSQGRCEQMSPTSGTHVFWDHLVTTAVPSALCGLVLRAHPVPF